MPSLRFPVWLLATCMLITGSINTIATKLQDRVVVGADAKGRPLTFKHPAVQTVMMFSGELLCLLPFFVRRWWRAAHRAARTQEDKDAAAARQRRATWFFALPALCDACGTTLLNLGLYYTYASVFQMLRGTLVLFAGMLTIVLLRRRLHMQARALQGGAAARAAHWLGMVLIAAGAALVGASSIVYDSQGRPAHAHGSGGGSHAPGRADHAAADGSARGVLALAAEGLGLVMRGGHRLGDANAPNPLLGDVLVVLAQLCTATQFIIEEKFLAKYKAPVMFAVGMEGAWGVALCALALPALARVRGPDGLPLDSVAKAAREIAGSFTLQWTTALVVLSIGLFNMFGVAVTKRLSGASRASIDACRTLLIWLFCLRAGWERFHMLQVVGFAILICGSSIYNDLLASCLPAPPPEHARGTSRRHRREGAVASAAAEAGLSQPLLEGGGPGGGGGRYGGRNVRFALEDGHEQQQQQQQQQGVPIRGARPLRDVYSMARSVTILPQALSPHSLASAPAGGLPGFSFRSDVQGYSSSACLTEGDEEGQEGTDAEGGSPSESEAEGASPGGSSPAFGSRVRLGR